MTVPARSRRLVLLLVAGLVAGACGAQTPSAAPTGTPNEAVVPTATPTASEPPIAAASPSPAPTTTATATLAPSARPDPTASPEPTAASQPSGMPTGRTGKITLDEIGLTLTLPRGWRSIPLTGEDVSAIMDILPEGTLPAGFEDQVATLVASGMKLFGIDADKANRGANVTVLAVPAKIPVGLLRTTAEIGISQVGGVRGIRFKDVKVDGEPALRVEYTLVLTINGLKHTSTGVQLWVPWDASTLAITLSTPKGGQAKDRDAIIRSLRLD